MIALIDSEDPFPGALVAVVAVVPLAALPALTLDPGLAVELPRPGLLLFPAEVLLVLLPPVVVGGGVGPGAAVLPSCTVNPVAVSVSTAVAIVEVTPVTPSIS